MSSFASPIPPPVFDSDESDVASQQSTDSSYLASQFARQRCSSQVLPPSSSQFFDESTCGSSSQPCQDESLLNDSMNIESALSRLTTLSQTPSEVSYQSSPQPSHAASMLLSKPKTTYTVKYATTNKRKRSSTRNRQDGGVALKTPDQSPLTRRKNLDYVQESTFRSPKVQRRSRHHDESISLTCSTTTTEVDLVNTNPFTPQPQSAQNKRFKCESPAISQVKLTTPRYRTRLAVKRDQQAAAAAAAHVPSERRQSFGTVPAGSSPSLRELTIRRFEEEFHQESLLGHGEFSHVYLCKNRLDGITYAVKASKQAVLGTSYERMAWRETCAHAVLISHENLVRYHSAWIEPDGRFFVQLEFCNAGSLEDLIEKNRRQSNVIAEGQLKQILHQMSDALSYMHAQDLAHLDVKPANIMLCHRTIEMQSTRDEHDYFFSTDDERTDIIYKLTDLGHVSQISLAAIEEDGDSRYLALEALQRAQSKQLNLAKCDIFSLGLTLYVAATNDELPRQGNEWQQLRLNISESLRSIPHCTSQLNQLLLAQMCHLDPNQRPSAYELLLDPNASPSMPTSRESLRHSLKRERQKNLMLNKKLLGHYLLTNSSDLQTLPTSTHETTSYSMPCQQLFVSPTQSNLVPQHHQYASTPNDHSRILLINTTPLTTTTTTNMNQSLASPTRTGNSLAMKQQTKCLGSNMLRHYSSII